MQFTPAEAKTVARERIQGLFTSPMTPHKSPAEIDYDAYRRDIRYLIDVLGVRGFYLHGFLAEWWLLKNEERLKLTQIALEEAGREIPIVANLYHPNLIEMMEMLERAEELGLEFVSLHPPYLARGSEEWVFGFFRYVAKQSRLGLMIFNTPQVGYGLAPEVIARLAEEIPQFCIVKDDTSFEQTKALCQLVGDSLVIIDPIEARMLENIEQHGLRTIMTPINQFYDRPGALRTRDYVEAAANGHVALARALFLELEAVRKVQEKWIGLPWRNEWRVPLARMKYWAGLMGLSGGPVRPPLPQISEEDRAAMRADLEALGLLPVKS